MGTMNDSDRTDSDDKQPNLNLGRREFVQLLHERLQHSWLELPAKILSLTDGLFGEHRSIQKQLATSLAQAFRERKVKTAAELHVWLTRSVLLKRLFRKSKKIEVQASAINESASSGNGLDWTTPAIEDEVQLSEYLLLGSHRVLDWLTLPHRRRTTDVKHYTQSSIGKRDGTKRLIESPRPILKRTQRVIASKILSQVPLHEAAIGFRPGFSIQNCAAPHIRRECVLRIDLHNFFGSIHFGRVRSLFKLAGYDNRVASSLAMLCTAPGAVSDHDDGGLRSRLPQGAPTSPAIANAICFRMDRRLAALSLAADVAYTRYADDLIFSLDSRSTAQVKRFAASVAVIAIEEGFAVNYHKTRIMRSGNVQRVLGMSVNQKLNVPRKQYETLKAILHNCVRDGALSQNRESHPNFALHLRGRISHIASIHPKRARSCWKCTDKWIGLRSTRIRHPIG